MSSKNAYGIGFQFTLGALTAIALMATAVGLGVLLGRALS
jgi:hypothetical protein